MCVYEEKSVCIAKQNLRGFISYYTWPEEILNKEWTQSF